MEQAEFLEKNVFNGLKNLNDGFADAQFQFFSESDFEKLLERVEYYGIGIYAIEAWKDNAFFEAAHHEDMNKKATDPAWYKKALLTFKMTETGHDLWRHVQSFAEAFSTEQLEVSISTK